MNTNGVGRSTMKDDLLLRDEVYAIIGAAMEVHNEAGAGYTEPIYQEMMEIELRLRGIPFERQKPLRLTYKGNPLEKLYIADLLCYATVLVELKAVERLTRREEAQILNYLKMTGIRVGLLINFADPVRLDWHRFVR
jgi:GxxExxY protein